MLLCECLLLVSPRCDDSPARILPWIEPLPRESIDRDYDGHCPAQTLRARFSGFSAEGVVLCWPSLGSANSPRLGGVGVKTKSCTGSSGAGAGTSPFLGLRTSLAAVGVNLQVSGFSRYFASQGQAEGGGPAGLTP
jgi:hypothetical protein